MTSREEKAHAPHSPPPEVTFCLGLPSSYLADVEDANSQNDQFPFTLLVCGTKYLELYVV
jgi:hypothetical protein